MERYARQIIVQNIGEDGQKKLTKGKVLVVGAGGLGCPVLVNLVAAGVGNIKIADFDVVSESNLNRQFLYSPTDIDKHKGVIAKEKLSKQNPSINIEVITEKITAENIFLYGKDVDVVVDCVDNVATRLLLNEFCLKEDIPLVEGAIFEFYGSLTVITRNSPCLKCLGYKEDTYKGVVGAVGATAGVMGALQATETIKILLGEKFIQGEILHYNGLNCTFDKIKMDIDKNCEHYKIK